MRIVDAVPELGQAVTVTSRGFVQPITDELVKDVANHLAGDIVLTLETDGGEVGGFATFRVDGELLYLAGAMIDPEHQRHSIGRRFISYAKERSGCSYLGLRTQSPIMWASGRRLCSTWVPAPDDQLFDGELISFLDRAVGLCGSNASVDPGFYGSPLYGDKPLHSDPEIQRWWDGICVFENGDAVICVGRFK